MKRGHLVTAIIVTAIVIIFVVGVFTLNNQAPEVDGARTESTEQQTAPDAPADEPAETAGENS